MKLSLKTLRDYVDIPVSVEEYTEKMIRTGTAVEGAEHLGAEIENVVVGRVLTCENVEGSDHLHLCTVDVGGEAPLQIVCGAPNVGVGKLVPVALDGAKLPGGMKIKKGKLRGIVSEGMLCAATELKVPQDLYDSVGDEGLLIFNEDYPLGSDVRPIFGLDDTAVDFEILANRPDCLCALGIARETAAALGSNLHIPPVQVKESIGKMADEVKVSVLDSDLCPRYAARVIQNVRIAPSPAWLRQYLHAAGLRSINNIVDITNFVMLEYGHPMHAFDLSHVRGKEIIVRRAKAGEQLTTLDGIERTLRTDDLVICDKEGATGLAGIMGGEESEITEATQTVMFECASFDRTAIRLTARAMGMRTESSGRFERGVAPETVMDALERACMLVNELDAGDVASGVVDIYPAPKAPRVITASVRAIQGRSGVAIPAQDMQRILAKLCFEVSLDGDTLIATVPPFRSDVEAEADLCEEVLRIYGYDHIGTDALKGETTQGGISPMLRLKNRAAGILGGLGYFEIMNYSFTGFKEIAKLGLAADDLRMQPMPIRNPLGEDTAVMRPTLVPDMLRTLAFNMNHATEAAGLYEMAALFDHHHPTAEGLPTETQSLCIGAYGSDVSFFSVRTVCEALLRMGDVAFDIVPGGDPYYHPGRVARLMHEGNVLAQIGEVHPNVREAFDMPKRAVIAEMNLALLLKLAQPMGEIKPLPRFPGITRDLALVMAENVAVGPLMADMRTAAGKLLENITMFDVYRNATQVGINLKSVAFSLAFRAPDRTLTDAEVQKALDKVQKLCAEKYDAVVRG